MAKFSIAALLIVHGLIHVLGFAKAIDIGVLHQWTIVISRQMGIWWLLAGCVFLTSAWLYLIKNEYWPFFAVIAVVLSQVIILSSWHDSRLGTIPNILILAVALLSLGVFRFEAQYRRDVKQSLQPGKGKPIELFTEKDLQPLPEPVQRYLRFAGVLDQPKVKNMRVVVTGQMRENGSRYFTFTSEQYNFFDEPTRLFFMKATMRSFPVVAYCKCINGLALRDRRYFGLIPFVQEIDPDMNQSEMRALFNDMCLLAPASLVDKRIKWHPLDSDAVTATFTNHGVSVAATLNFNSQGQLLNFLSDDPVEGGDKKPHRFSTPISSYKTIKGFNLFNQRESIWNDTDEKLTDGTFTLADLSYNVTS